MVKRYSDFIQILKFKHPVKRRLPGFELRNPATTSPRELTPEEIEENKNRACRRAKSKVRDLALMNEFDKFLTLTLDPKKHDAYDYAYCMAKVTKFFQNQAAKHGKFRYIIVPEQMKDGKWHFHALIGEFTGKYHATRTRGTGKTVRQCYKVDAWEKNYGFADMEDISDPTRIANYITKYISKDFDKTAKNAKRYWCSKGLKMPEVEYNPEISELLPQIDLNNAKSYSNSHVDIATFPLKGKPLKHSDKQN